MAIHVQNFCAIKETLQSSGAALVAVSKTKPVEDIAALYALGQRDFGENYVQELAAKSSELPADVRWHFIGHLQTNKVKYIAPFVHLIHSVDSLRLLQEINKQGAKLQKKINVLLQVFIAGEETKFGLDEAELKTLLEGPELTALSNIQICGFMGMASFTSSEAQIRGEFARLKTLFDTYRQQNLPHTKLEILSMGMSGDYKLALAEGSNMVRIGSMLFGSRG